MCVVPIIIYETLAGIPGFAREHSKRITNVSEADFFCAEVIPGEENSC